MNRIGKQIAYGLFYCALLGGIIFLFYNRATQIAQSCFDGKQNQNETGIDCGGQCVPCKSPISVSENIKIFRLPSGGAALLGWAENVNSDYGIFSAEYYFRIFDSLGVLIETVPGAEPLYPGEKRYIYSPDAKVRFGSIGTVTLDFFNPTWRDAKEFSLPSLEIKNIETSLASQGLITTFTIHNKSPFPINQGAVVGIAKNHFGSDIMASETLVTAIPAFAEVRGTLFFPAGDIIKNQTDINATELFFQPYPL